MRRKYTNPKAVGYLLEAKACELVCKELRRIAEKYKRAVEKEAADRQLEFETALQYTSEVQIQDAKRRRGISEVDGQGEEKEKNSMNTLCTLKFREAIELIQNRPQVYYKHGVWNKYEHRDTQVVISSIKRSGYGADVAEKDGELYVSIPADCDMW